jgi:hypothetical protein
MRKLTLVLLLSSAALLPAKALTSDDVYNMAAWTVIYSQECGRVGPNTQHLMNTIDNTVHNVDGAKILAAAANALDTFKTIGKTVWCENMRAAMEK